MQRWNPSVFNNMDNLEGIVLSGISQTEKDKWYMGSLICGQERKQTNELCKVKPNFITVRPVVVSGKKRVSGE